VQECRVKFTPLHPQVGERLLGKLEERCSSGDDRFHAKQHPLIAKDAILANDATFAKVISHDLILSALEEDLDNSFDYDVH